MKLFPQSLIVLLFACFLVLNINLANCYAFNFKKAMGKITDTVKETSNQLQNNSELESKSRSSKAIQQQSSVTNKEHTETLKIDKIQKDEDLCLSGVCIGDNIANIDVPWIDFSDKTRGYTCKIEHALKKVNKRAEDLTGESYDLNLSDFCDLRNGDLCVSDRDMIKIVPYLSLHLFDSNVLRNFLAIKAVCKYFHLYGFFESKSGFITRVKIIPIMIEPANSLSFRVVKIDRYFAVNSLDELNRIEILLKKKFPSTVDDQEAIGDHQFLSVWDGGGEGITPHLPHDFERVIRKKGRYYGVLTLHSKFYNDFFSGSMKFQSEMTKELRSKQPFCQKQVEKISID